MNSFFSSVYGAIKNARNNLLGTTRLTGASYETTYNIQQKQVSLRKIAAYLTKGIPNQDDRKFQTAKVFTALCRTNSGIDGDSEIKIGTSVKIPSEKEISAMFKLVKPTPEDKTMEQFDLEVLNYLAKNRKYNIK